MTAGDDREDPGRQGAACDTCRYHQYDILVDEIICCCMESPRFCEMTGKKDSCTEYKRASLLQRL